MRSRFSGLFLVWSSKKINTTFLEVGENKGEFHRKKKHVAHLTDQRITSLILSVWLAKAISEIQRYRQQKVKILVQVYAIMTYTSTLPHLGR